jgi:hypothetical protein
LALTAIAERLADSPFAVWAGESANAYPAANVVHVLGVVLLVGGIGIVDLRLVGLFRALPLQALARALTPLAVAGLILIVLSGSILFAADAKALALNGTFRIKLALIAVAIANALLFRWRAGGLADEPGPGLRLMALASLLLWVAVAVCGRLIAYSA